MKRKKIDNEATGSLGKFIGSSTIGHWFFQYRWHWILWGLYFLYAYITDYISYPYYVYPAKEILIFVTHPVFLFYGFVYCLNRFSRKTYSKLAVSLVRFTIILGAFWAIRVLLNYYIYPLMDTARGLEKENLITHDFIINGCIWCIDYLIKGAGYFYLMKYMKKQKEHQQLRIAKVEQEKVLLEKQIEEERSKQQQREYEQRERMFINLVHETKTPITLITNKVADYIHQHGSSAELEGIRSSVNKLSRDITNLFDLERFRHGVEMFNHNQWIDFSTLLTNAYDTFAPYCKKKGIQLSRNIKEGVMIGADPAALTRIVNNLVENAIKYSPAETEISLMLSSEHGVVSLEVCDQGQGIAEEDLETIFLPYHLLNKRKQNFQGMGLGLPMVNNIVESLDGEISISNNESSGMTVTVLLPVGEKAELAEMGESEPYFNVIEEREPIQDMHINEESALVLVIEDNHNVNSYLVRKLAQKFNVRSALNGKEALEKIKDELPDFIVSDVMMDGMDGFEFARIIKETPALSHIPIIFLTAKDTEVDKMKGLALGAIDYMVKPFVMDELLKKVDSLLGYTDRQQRRLYNDIYKAVKMMKRKGDHSTFDQIDSNVHADPFLTWCQNVDLTKREMEIARLLMAGKSNKAIAELSFISIKTVETHVKNIYEKAGVTSKVAFVKLLH